MNGQEYRTAILSTGLSITAYTKHIGLTRQSLHCRFKLTNVTNEIVLAVERVADRWRPMQEHTGDMFLMLVIEKLTGRLSMRCRAVFIDATGVLRVLGSVGGTTSLRFTPTHWKPLPKWEIEP
jgi:hypothetical protein